MSLEGDPEPFDEFLKEYSELFSIFGIFGAVTVYLSSVETSTEIATAGSAVGVFCSYSIMIQVLYHIYDKIVEEYRKTTLDLGPRVNYFVLQMTMLGVMGAVVSLLFEYQAFLVYTPILIITPIAIFSQFYILTSGILRKLGQPIRDRTEIGFFGSSVIVYILVIFTLLTLYFIGTEPSIIQSIPILESAGPSESAITLIRGTILPFLYTSIISVVLIIIAEIIDVEKYTS